MLSFLQLATFALAGLTLADPNNSININKRNPQDVGVCVIGEDSPCNGNTGNIIPPAIKPTCTKTLTHTSVECCGTIAGHTVTSYTNCKGCVAKYKPTPLCRCFAPPPTDMALTSTRTACAAAKNPSMTTSVALTAPTGVSIGYGKGRQPCTTTLEVAAKSGGCGSCGHTYATTRTAEVDCRGCEVQTREVGQFGACVCPTATETWVTACRVTPTAL